MLAPHTSPPPPAAPLPYEQSIATVFETCVLRFGDRIAIRDNVATLTYNQLNSAANRIALEILKLHPGAGQPVGLFFRSKPLFLAALLGVLKTGGFALPIDPDFPDSHNHYIIHDSQARIFLTDNELISQAASLFPAGTSFNTQALAASSLEENLRCPVPADANAILLYTSGSTGKPKGVLHTQRSLLHNAMRQVELMHFGTDDRLSMLYSTSVMGTARDYLNALTTGASLHPFDIRTQGIAPFLDWISLEELTVLHTVPSFFRQLGVSPPRPEQLQSLRLVILGGEAVLKSDFDIYRIHFPDDCRLFTGLGSTETGTVRHNILDKTARIADGAIPLGYPIRDVDILLFDEQGSQVPPGEVGEIVVCSPYLATGYWLRPELNAEVFLPDPRGGAWRRFRTGDLGRFLPDGCLVHCGRKDLQVKIRGYRIELQEVEAALLATGLVKGAVVVGHNIKEGDYRLVAFVIPLAVTGDLAGALRLALADRLPAYMTPSLFVPLKAFPRTPNGKVDRQALPAPEFRPESVIIPVGGIGLEAELAHIWGDILSVRLPGLDDDFFALGGDSLHATLLFIEVEKRFGVRLLPAVLLENNTIRLLAALITGDVASWGKSMVAIRPQGTRKPLFTLPGGYGDVLYLRNLEKYIQEDRPLYGLQASSAAAGRSSYSWNMEAIASAYLVEILQVQPESPYYLAGHSFGGYVAMEIARQLTEQGRKVAFLGLWDTFPPGPRREARFPERLLIHLENMRGLGPRQLFGYLKDRWTSLLARAAHLAPVRSYLRWINYRPQNAMVAARLSRYSYHPQPYPGDLFLFKVSQRPWYVRWDPMENWRKYVQGKLEVREVQGEHGNMLFEPNVQELARQLNDCLRQAEAR